jgi:arylsulfatase A
MLSLSHASNACHAEDRSAPNIVFILADDMGYGDVSCYNPESKIQTPAIDRLAKQGTRFTDAHAAGTLCRQSRYGLMTGRYPGREAYKHIDTGRMTVASLLKKNGYNTAMVGKWHLGFDRNDGRKGWQGELRDGPVDRGFDSFFGMWASLDIPPYFYIRDRQAVALPTNTVAANNTPGWSKIQGEFWRKGGIAPGLKFEEVMPRFTQEAVAQIDKLAPSSKKGKPFFLYFAFTGPHTPWVATKKFQGKSEVDIYGDFVMQMDDSVQQVLAALDKNGVSDNTLVIFSSDNGPVWYPSDTKKYKHAATGIMRGMKADAWEGGHRMPFIVRWPGKVPAGGVSDEVICFTDMLKTFAAIVGDTIPAGTTQDSWNVLPAFLGQKLATPIRPYLIVKTFIRQGPWKLIPHGGSGGFSSPRREPGIKGQLYNLAKDPSETNNLYKQQPEKVEELMTLMKKVKKVKK